MINEDNSIKEGINNISEEQLNKINKFLEKKATTIVELFKGINNKERTDIKMDILNIEEINKNINNNDMNEVILINEENLNKFKSILIYDKIISYINKKNNEERIYI